MTARRALLASAPTRLDFGGGWTDVPPYPEERGGFVCNLAINRRATVRLSDRTGAPNSAPTDRLIAAALRKANIGPHDAPSLELSSDFPVGAGLGGSSAAGVALAAALTSWQELVRDSAAIAEWSRAVEVEELGIAGGRQDHYAAAFGGALGLTFATETTVESIPLSPECAHALEQRCLLLYTGESRISSATITAVLDGYRDRDSRVVSALHAMRELAVSMRHAIAASDIDTLAALVGEHWVHQRALHPGISTARIDAIEQAAGRAGAVGMKALGASGGGCVVVFAPADRVEAVRDAVSSLAEPLTWQVDRQGVAVTVQ